MRIIYYRYHFLCIFQYAYFCVIWKDERKEKYNPCGLPITDADSHVYVSCDPLNLSLPLYCYFLRIVSLCLNSQGFFCLFVLNDFPSYI